MNLHSFRSPLCILLFLLSFGCSDVKTVDCSTLKEGVFKLVSASDEKEIIITRSPSYQIERKFGTNNALKFDIKWTSVCDYILYNGRKISGEGIYKAKSPDTTYCQIINVNGNKHEVLTYKYNEVKQHKYTLTKVKIARQSYK
jgi:hypothetical protein